MKDKPKHTSTIIITLIIVIILFIAVEISIKEGEIKSKIKESYSFSECYMLYSPLFTSTDIYIMCVKEYEQRIAHNKFKEELILLRGLKK